MSIAINLTSVRMYERTPRIKFFAKVLAEEEDIHMRGLNGKRVIVTGGGSGIGRAVCERFGEEGAEVAIFDMN